MEIPELIDIVYSKVLAKYREQIEKDDRCNIMINPEKEKSDLYAQLNDEQKKLLNSYISSLELKSDYINYQLNTLLLHIAIKYGMDLQKTFNEQ